MISFHVDQLEKTKAQLVGGSHFAKYVELKNVNLHLMVSNFY